MRDVLDRELAQVRSGIAQLGEMVLQASHDALASLRDHSLQATREVREKDKLADAARYEIENACLITIATQQPAARDLRELLAASIVATELERCGDYAKGIARAARRILKSSAAFELFNLVEMEQLATDMLQRSVQAFLHSDVEAARQVLSDDDKVDQLYADLVNKALSSMSHNASSIEAGIWLLHAAHCLERIGDRATNIAERALFVATGEPMTDFN